MGRNAFYTKGWLLKLAVLALPTLGDGFLLFIMLLNREWNAMPMFLLFFLVNVSAAVLVIIRIKKPRLCYQNRNCCFCPCAYGNIGHLHREITLDLPAPYQWEKWAYHTQKYTAPIKQSLARFTNSQFSLMSSGGSGEHCAVPFDIDQRNCVGLKLCYFSRDVSPLRSDHDVMFIPDIYASEFRQGQPAGKIGILTGGGITPGFAQLVLNDTTLSGWTPYCFRQSGWYYLTPDLVRSMTYSAVKAVSVGTFPGSRTGPRCSSGILECIGGRIVSVEEVGPAVKMNIEDDQFPWWSLLFSVACCMAACPLCCALSDSTRQVYFEADLIVSVWCPVWPTCAQEWVTRARHWPPAELVADVASSGCHLVPKPPKITLDKRLEWRWSFSLPEIKLSFAYTPHAKMCYLLLKLLLKNYLKYRCPDLKTYHIKTILLWFHERNPVEIWSENSVSVCVDLLLEEIIGCVESRRLPNYWLPEVNLFENMPEPVSQDLAVNLRNIKAQPDLYFANLGAAFCGHRVLNCFNALVVGPLFLIFIVIGIILLGSLSDQNLNSYYNETYPWNLTHTGNVTNGMW